MSLGPLPVDGMGEFFLPQGLLAAGYRIIDVSQEPADGDPSHSGVSVVRGALRR